jgi:hypothetical protein
MYKYFIQIKKKYIAYINMLFQVVHPVVMTINAESFKDAVKNFVKMNQDLTLTSLILTDQSRYMKANLNFYNEANKHKVGISLFPTVWPLGIKNDGEIVSPLGSWPYSPSISYDTKEYPSTTFIDGGFVPRIVPLVPSLGPLVSPLPGLGTSVLTPGSLFSPLSSIGLPNLAGTVYRF